VASATRLHFPEPNASPDEDVFANSLLWRNLLLRTCSTLLWEGERVGKRVAVWGGKGEADSEL
jgi:hypothetical protein